ncbi:hypothetical protein COCNU_10G003720 [Cocos nucifera]|uniref:Uncharacterized protein n=1 Tax=Cocos nucifera TaxID=13894 RepID=A0A8K0N830_COCNU|nr:hypothetical protein COCNU_10G003720 [Cocos nucifera]
MPLKSQGLFGLVVIPYSWRHAARQCPFNLQFYLSLFSMDIKAQLQFPSTTILSGFNIWLLAPPRPTK